MIKFYYYDSSFYAAVFANTAFFFDYHTEVPEDFSRDFPEEKMASFKERFFFISHTHTDHYTPDVFRYSGDNTYFIIDSTVPRPESSVKNVFSVKKGDTLKIGGAEISVFGSTDEGSSFGIDFMGRRIFHSGDLNLWHWTGENTAEEEAFARKFFLSELSFVKENFGRPDVAMFPVDSRMMGDYAEGAKVYIKEVNPAVFLPMHFWGDWSAPENFSKLDFEGTKIISPKGFGFITEL